jgi:hypothetical protein
MKEDNEYLLYLLHSMTSVLPNLFGCAVDVFWGDMLGSLLLDNCEALAKLVEERHSCFSFRSY